MSIALDPTDPNLPPEANGNPLMGELHRAYAGLSPQAQQVHDSVYGTPGSGIAKITAATAPATQPSPVSATMRATPAATINPSATQPTTSAAPMATGPIARIQSNLPEAEAEYNRLATSTPGYQQIHNPWVRGLATAGNILGSGVFPRIAAEIPGTSAHHEQLVNQAAGNVKNEENLESEQAKNQQEAAQTKNLESLPDLHKAQLENAQTKNELLSQKQTEIEQHHNDQIDAQLRQHGYKRDPETGSILPLEYAEMSPEQQSVHDLRASQKEVQDATAELDKAKKQNLPVQMQMAQQRIATAQHNASIAAERLGLSKAQFEAREFGTNNGTPLPGAMIGDDGRPIGSAFQQNVRPTGQERNKADLAESAHVQLSDIKSIIQKRPDIFGPAEGRKTDFTVWLGSQDPDAQRFRAARTIAADHLAGVFGGRSEAALNALDAAIGHFKDNPKAVLAGIDQLDKANTGFVNKGTVKTAGSDAAKANPTNATNQSSGGSQQSGGQNIPTVTTQDQFDKLPKGAIYIGDNGKKMRKP